MGGTEGGRVINEAREFLEEILASGSLPQKEIKAAAEGAGISWPGVRRAKERLGVTAVRESVGASGAGRWLWSLPGTPIQDPQGAQGAHFHNVGTLHENGHFSGDGEHLAESGGTVGRDTFGAAGQLNGEAPNDVISATPEPALDPDLGIPDFLRRQDPPNREIRHPAISAGPNDSLDDFF